MKKKILIVSLVVIVVAILATTSLAYFTDGVAVHNIITTNHVDVELVEKHLTPEGDLVDFPKEGIDEIVAGDTASKIVSVQNNGAEAWIRVKVETVVVDRDGKELPIDPVSFEVDETKWTFKDGYYYYLKPVATGASTDVLFSEVDFSTAMGNEYKSGKVELHVFAQGVQTANNGATVMEAAGWPLA